MPKLDFYVLTDTAPDAPLRFVCRLAEKAVDQAHRVYIRVSDDDEAKRIDDLLWTFGDRSFLPHEIATERSPSHPKINILIGNGPPPEAFRDVLINLGHTAPDSLDTVQRIAEIVPADAERKKAARERFKFYRDRGIEPETHNV
jgi:DNA polymerase-3 subunit chi